mgnify:CR=1 FL=1
MIKDLLQEGFALKNRGHYKHAIEVFYKALELDNTSNELLLEIAELYYKMQNEERALNYIEQILDNNPKHIEALKLLKQIFIDKNALAEAEQTAKNIYCISCDIDDLAEIFNLLNKQQKFDEVFEYNIEKLTPAIILELAKAHYCKKEYQIAQELIINNIENIDNHQDILLLLGQILYAQGKKDECVELLSRLQINKQNAELMNFCGLIKDYQGHYREACSNLLSAIKLEPKNDKFYYNLANVYFKEGEIDYARKYYNLAISLNPNNSRYHFALANLYYAQKNYKKALEELPNNLLEANLLKITILYDTGYLALAKQEIENLLKQYPNNDILNEYSQKINNDLGI